MAFIKNADAQHGGWPNPQKKATSAAQTVMCQPGKKEALRGLKGRQHNKMQSSIAAFAKQCPFKKNRAANASCSYCVCIDRYVPAMKKGGPQGP